jgi:hypothetical protein
MKSGCSSPKVSKPAAATAAKSLSLPLLPGQRKPWEPPPPPPDDGEALASLLGGGAAAAVSAAAAAVSAAAVVAAAAAAAAAAATAGAAEVPPLSPPLPLPLPPPPPLLPLVVVVVVVAVVAPAALDELGSRAAPWEAPPDQALSRGRRRPGFLAPEARAGEDEEVGRSGVCRGRRLEVEGIIAIPSAPLVAAAAEATTGAFSSLSFSRKSSEDVSGTVVGLQLGDLRHTKSAEVSRVRE